MNFIPQCNIKKLYIEEINSSLPSYYRAHVTLTTNTIDNTIIIIIINTVIVAIIYVERTRSTYIEIL